VVGIDSMKVLEQEPRDGRNFKKLDEAALKKLVAKVKGVAATGGTSASNRRSTTTGRTTRSSTA